MKLKLKGYILRRCDTNEYLKELIINDNVGLTTWTSLSSDAGLFNSKYDAIIVGSDISDAIKIVMKLSQVFKFENDYLVSCIAEYDPEFLASKLNSTSL